MRDLNNLDACHLFGHDILNLIPQARFDELESARIISHQQFGQTRSDIIGACAIYTRSKQAPDAVRQ